jgi:undecaprenyl-diphosphatase
MTPPAANSRAGDAALVALTRAANHSVLWMAVAAALALADGERGRRAAVRGLGAVALASAASNGPLKLAFRRPRPARRPPLIRQPRSSSFPSGHSASAFAFATAAAAELPAVAPLVVPLAAAVAYSRVRVGVHRPSEVLAGSAVGAVAGAFVSSVARGRRRVAPAGPPTPAGPPAPPGGLPAEVVLVVSPPGSAPGGSAPGGTALRSGGTALRPGADVPGGDRRARPGLPG